MMLGHNKWGFQDVLILRKQALLWLAITTFAFSFVFVRIYDSRDVFFVPAGGDDLGYYVYTEAILKTHTLNWLDPRFTYNYGSEFNRYSPGPALLLLPFTSFGLLLEKAGVYSSPGLDNLRFWSVIGTFVLFFFWNSSALFVGLSDSQG